jgi:hypothetical protein
LLLIEVRHFVQKLPVDGTADDVFFLPRPTFQQVNVMMSTLSADYDQYNDQHRSTLSTRRARISLQYQLDQVDAMFDSGA